MTDGADGLWLEFSSARDGVKPVGNLVCNADAVHGAKCAFSLPRLKCEDKSSDFRLTELLKP